MKTKILGVMIASVLAAETNGPQVTVEQRAKFWKAQAEYIAASVQFQKAKTAMETVQAELAKTCGEQQLIANSDGEPACQAKPATESK